jgi:hypothetical protein
MRACVRGQRTHSESQYTLQLLPLYLHAAHLNLRFLYKNLLHYILLACWPVKFSAVKNLRVSWNSVLKNVLNIQFFMKSGKKPFSYVPNSFSGKSEDTNAGWLIRLQHEMRPYVLL